MSCAQNLSPDLVLPVIYIILLVRLLRISQSFYSELSLSFSMSQDQGLTYLKLAYPSLERPSETPSLKI